MGDVKEDLFRSVRNGIIEAAKVNRVQFTESCAQELRCKNMQMLNPG